jgi:hypothetical protein
MLVNLDNYRIARKFLSDVPNILKVVGLAIQALSKYTMYKPVASMIAELRKTQAYLEAHRFKAEEVVAKSRGDENGKT